MTSAAAQGTGLGSTNPALWLVGARYILAVEFATFAFLRVTDYLPDYAFLRGFLLVWWPRASRRRHPPVHGHRRRAGRKAPAVNAEERRTYLDALGRIERELPAVGA